VKRDQIDSLSRNLKLESEEAEPNPSPSTPNGSETDLEGKRGKRVFVL
jgi:hypothetical protein